MVQTIRSTAPQAANQRERNMNSVPILRVIVDVTILVILAIVLLCLSLFAHPIRRGFFCDDDSIKYPYKEDLITRTDVGLIGAGVCTVMMIITEIGRIFYENRKKYRYEPFKMRNRQVHRIFIRLYVFLGYMIMGGLMNQIITEIAKYTIGRLRPHFLAVCQPDVTCFTSPGYPDNYVMNYTCKWEADPPDDPTLKRRMHDARQSFPSGHSSSVFYFMTFLTLYLKARIYWPVIGTLVVPTIQLCALATAVFVSLSRISDYKHHWSDVLAGSVLGFLIAIFVVCFIAELWSRREVPCKYNPFPWTTIQIIEDECELRENLEMCDKRRVTLPTHLSKNSADQTAQNVHLTTSMDEGLALHISQKCDEATYELAFSMFDSLPRKH